MQSFGLANTAGRCRGLICCNCESPFVPENRRCFDPGSDRAGVYRQECRDCFWPVFSHPQWLCCRILYGCCCRPRVGEGAEGAGRRGRGRR